MSPIRDSKAADIYRKLPVQRRSRGTIGFIVEAAFQVLRDRGEDAVTTTAVAERAGVSVGTVYQYFGDRDALLKALGERERLSHLDLLRRLLARPRGQLGGDAVRDYVRATIRALGPRRGARRQFALLATAVLSAEGSWRRDEFEELLVGFYEERWPGGSPEVNRINAFVLTHAMIGALHAAAVRQPCCLDTPEFEDALCDLVRSLSPRDRHLPHATGPEAQS